MHDFVRPHESVVDEVRGDHGNLPSNQNTTTGKAVLFTGVFVQQ